MSFSVHDPFNVFLTQVTFNELLKTVEKQFFIMYYSFVFLIINTFRMTLHLMG